MPQNNNQKILQTLVEMHANVRGNTYINTTVKDTVQKILDNVENDDVKLKVNKIWINEKHDNADIAIQQDVRNKGQVWSNDLRADLELIDKQTGKVVDHQPNIKISSIPKLTDRGTFLVGGNEYQFTKQSRLKPGVYTREQSNGQISSFFNVDKTIDFDRGFNNNFRLTFDPETKRFIMSYGSKNVPLINGLRAIGVTNEEMGEYWGNDVFKANDKAYGKYLDRDQSKLYQAIYGVLPDRLMSREDIQKQIKDRLFSTELDSSTTKITLGKSFGSVDKEPLLMASKKIIDIHRGEVEGDDRESLIFKSFYDIEDHMREKLVKNSDKISGNIAHKLKKHKAINKSISSQLFDPYVVGVVTNSQLSNPPNQTNPMAIIGDSNKLTVMGEGGIGTPSAITNETRQISNSEMGFIDPLHTPEGSNIGVAVHLSMDTIKAGNDLFSKFRKPNGEVELLRPIDTWEKNIAFPDEYDLSGNIPKPKHKNIKVVSKGKLSEVSSDKVDAIVDSAKGMFDTSVNMIPFLDSIQGNRGLTASKMQEQALSLIHRDRPLFDIVDEKKRNLNTAMASQIALPMANIDGTITSVSPNSIEITDRQGKKHEQQLYNNFSLNSESFLHNEPLVKSGDKVKRGQVLADNNFTRNGSLALGANLRVAYMPYHGFNYEDSAIMSESAAKKLTSEHLYDFKDKRSADGIFSKNKFKAYYPEELLAANAVKLDADGIVKPGETVNRDDVLIAHLERKAPTADDIAVGRLDKQLRRDMANRSIHWDNDHIGTVTDVKKHGNSVVVSVKTQEPLKEADKISGLHGNKHIISKIVPDDQMPIDAKTGKRIDLTMSPIGVSNRINPSQILENAVGKIAEATGIPYVIQNFKDIDNARQIMSDLKKSGLSDKDILIDPETNQPLKNPVATGISHILKLEHKVDHKFSARYKDGYDSNEQAVSGGHTGGKNLGRMEVAALLARGSNENLKEMFSIKGQKNDEFWHAMETGQSLPPPKKAFVWDKMLSNMAGAGINVEQKGKTFTLKPMTDVEILQKSKGELKDPTLTYRKKDLAPLKDGLFDPALAGGMQGEHYTHFHLPEAVLNPITASASATLLNMPKTTLEDIITGKKFINKTTKNIVEPGSTNAISGGPAIEMMLSEINVDSELKSAEENIQNTRNPSEINKLHRKIKTLKHLKQSNMKPVDYMVHNVLVTPSKFRPMFSMGTENTIIMSDINDLYQQTAHTANALNDLGSQLKKSVKDEDIINLQLAEARGELYKDLNAVAGLQEPTSYLHRAKNKKGFISQIDGGKEKQTKEGFFQSKVLERRQDLVGRSTIILNPDLGGDQIGIPKDMATEIFQPFIMKKLVGWGYSPLEAKKQIEDKTKVFERARQVVSDERLVIANRAPTLHKWNMTAFNPILTDGKSIEVPAVVISKNFGGDFDGDCGLSTIITSINISQLQCEIQKNKKIRFDSDLYIDSNENVDYITSILKLMEVRMPSVEKLLVDHEVVAHMHISQFPRIEETKKVKDNGNEEYDVPDGVSIFTIDNVTHEFKKVPVKTFSIHKNLPNYTIETSSGDSMLLSHDQSAVAINRATWEIEKVTPEDLKDGRMIPKIRNTDIETTVFDVPLIDYSKSEGPSHLPTNHCKESVKLDNDFGWLVGAMVGDGWVSNTNGENQLCLSAMDENIGDKFCRILNTMLDREATPTIIDNTHEFEGHQCFSKKYTISTSALTDNFVPWIGKGAYNKHLPPFYMSAPREFREGLLAGLLDTDGTVCWLQKKNGRQFNIQYSSMSEVLIDEIVSLCRSLGISASISLGNKRPDGIERRAVLSTNTVHGKQLSIVHKAKSAALAEFYAESLRDSSVSARQDLVPFSPEILMIAKDFVHHVENKALYNNINDSKRYCWRISRQSAKRLIELDVEHKLPKRWVDIVQNENTTWVYATSVELNKHRVDMYDITAPGPYTFMLSNGIIVQDTFQIHVPIGTKALKEAESMKPSASMLKTGYDTVLNKPEMDMVAGTWLVSKGMGGKDAGFSFENIEQAKDAFKAGKITYADQVTIKNRKAPFGIHDINSVVPDKSQKWGIDLNSKNIEDWIKDVTKEHNGKIALGLSDKMKEIGNNYSTTFGFTLGVSDILSEKDIRKPLLQMAAKVSKTGKEEDIVEAYSQASMLGQQALTKKHGQSTMLGIGIESGAGKGIGNTTALTLMPGIVTDANDRPIPMPITKAYSEGLGTFDYWAAAHGARGGNIKKSISSYMPGWLTKDLTNSIYDTRISADEPVDSEGVEYSTQDKKGIFNRFLATDVKDTGGKTIAKRNEVVTSDVVNRLNKSNIKSIRVQSPLTDPTPHDGFSSYSYGVDHEGKRHNIGDNIGIISSHTVTEPSLNMAMKAFHTGGAFEGKKKATGTLFDRLDRTLRFTKTIPDKASLASMNGVVKDIIKSPIGGFDVILSDGQNEEVRYIDTRNDVIVKKGQTVKSGDSLSTGTPSMHDILKYKGMPETQRFLVEQIDDIVDHKLDKRDIETIVRGITNTTRVLHPGSNSNLVAGDVTQLTAANYFNNNNEKDEDLEDSLGDHLAQNYGQLKKHTKINKNIINQLDKIGVKRPRVFKDRIKHEPFLTPTGIQAKAASSEDWIARLAHNRIRRVLEEGTTQGWKTTIDPIKGHPIPQYITGEYTW